jgi:MFS family permease
MPLYLFVPFLFASRLFGLFSFVPVAPAILVLLRSSDAESLTYLLASYSFFQACFQYPLAWLSDRYGRLRIIRLGLVLFIIGSFVSYGASSFSLLLLGRSLQGAGAIGATAQALLADHAEVKMIQTHYYLIGIAIMLSLIVSFSISPLFLTLFHPQDVFIVGAAIACLPLVSSFWIDEPIHHQRTVSSDAERSSLTLWILIGFTFILHCLQMYSFALCGLLETKVSATFYAKTFGLALIFACYPLAKRALTLSFSWAFIFSAFAVFLIMLSLFNMLSINLLIYFLIFNIFVLLLLLEASLPVLLGSVTQKRGAVMGLYSTAQYLGMSLGPFLLMMGLEPKSIILITLILYLGMTGFSYKAIQVARNVTH